MRNLPEGGLQYAVGILWNVHIIQPDTPPCPHRHPLIILKKSLIVSQLTVKVLNEDVTKA